MTVEQLIILDCDIEQKEAEILELESTINASKCGCPQSLSKIRQLKTNLNSLINTKLDMELLGEIPQQITTLQT